MLTLAQRERVAEGRVRGFCAATTGTANTVTGQCRDIVFRVGGRMTIRPCAVSYTNWLEFIGLPK